MRQRHISIFPPRNIIIVTGLLWMFCFAGIAYAISPNLLPFDQDDLGDRIPLILIHGIQNKSQSAEYWHVWDNFEAYIGSNNVLKAAIKPYYFTYETIEDYIGNGPTSIYGVAKVLRDKIQARDDTGEFLGKPIIIIAHSMGGLVARSLMQELEFADGIKCGEKISKLITSKCF